MAAFPVKMQLTSGVIEDGNKLSSKNKVPSMENVRDLLSLNNNGPEVCEATSAKPEFGGISGNVRSFYSGASVFITGGTGFLGKALLEKMLRTFEDLEVVYVLLRPKKGMNVEQRYKELIKNTIFDRIRSKDPTVLEKLRAVAGDVSQPDLGLSVVDRERMAATVNIVVHSAATIRFVEPLGEALTLNTLGTKRLLEMCKTFQHLKSIVHVSTAYSNPDKNVVDERLYPAPQDPDVLLQCAAVLPVETLDLITPQLQGAHPNTYTLTKALGEHIVKRYGVGLPICIVRPSIVTAAVNEPYPGWIDNVFGVTGIIMEISRGTIRSSISREHCVMDIVPVDMAVNTCITAAWHHTNYKSKDPLIYNCTSGQLNPVSWGDFTRLAVQHARIAPSKYVMLYPNFRFTTSRLANFFWELATHYLPNVLFDLVLRAQGKKPIMMKIARRFKMAMLTGQFFSMRQWDFKISNLQGLSEAVGATGEGEDFPVTVANVDWDAYVGVYLAGIRKYVLKDGMESMPAAKRKLQRLYWTQKFLQAISGYYTYKLFFGKR